jgi:hypothetical protein
MPSHLLNLMVSCDFVVRSICDICLTDVRIRLFTVVLIEGSFIPATVGLGNLWELQEHLFLIQKCLLDPTNVCLSVCLT